MPSVPKPQRERTKHYFKEWRQYRDLSQEKAIGRLNWSQSKISRLEAGQTPYNQDDLENAAQAYSCSTTDIISVNPYAESDIVDLTTLFRKMSEEDRKQALKVITALAS